ncbi:hypothetical protein PHLGIDRAFT_431774 [Phlebiopsis gigantea 11061_1 CR5-6]|uniref:F-box domain-containing protein n=1 Tax=Phlebiopsis gigantea (strain 11061_1 CR5-6) TaxID=745531 RepID=A0A0C3S7Y9_PHLG1|nr:hypothetical protein PHLGIDRAFT_431774 [Phlebiopsis gigantea 11061_1 CR5-6]
MSGLPDDILLHIFDQIDSFRDATNLCLTNSRVLLVGLRRVEQLCRRTLAPWSGDRVIAVRATFKLSLPDPVTGLTRQQELYPNLVEPDVLRPRGDLFAHFEMQEPDRPAGLIKGFTQFNPMSDPSSFCPPGFQWHRFGGMFLHNYPDDVAWVICNLTKREYAIAQDAEGCSSENKTLDIRRNRQFASKLRCTENWDATMQKVCWSMTIRGTWAGDRISIVALSQAQSRYTDWSQWKEVTVTRRYLDTGVAT